MKILEKNFVIMSLVGTFIKETNYKLKPINREVEVGDMLEIDRETGKIINYGSINNIVNSEEFKRWMSNDNS